MKISGSVCLVTGGASGIGKATCDILLTKGAKVIVLDVNEQRGKEVKSEFELKHGSGKVEFLACDISSAEQFKETFEAAVKVYGRLDAVCNIAGILKETDWKKTIDINLGGVVQGTLLAMEHMEGGVIINISSRVGNVPYIPSTL